MPTVLRSNGHAGVDTGHPGLPRRRDASARSLLAVLVLLASLLAAGGPASPIRAASPAPAASYRLDVSIDLDRAMVTTSETVQFRNVVGVALETLVFRVVTNTLGAFQLTSLTVDGQPVEGRLDGSVLELALATPPATRPSYPGRSWLHAGRPASTGTDDGDTALDGARATGSRCWRSTAATGTGVSSSTSATPCSARSPTSI